MEVTRRALCAAAAGVLLCLSARPAGAQAAGTGSGGESDAFLDAGARELLVRARSRRGALTDSITHYSARVRERISVRFRAIRRERLVYRREVAARLDWTRDGAGTVEMLGAREAVPIALKGVRLPEDLDSDAGDLLFIPGSEELLLGLREGEFARHPLAAGSEADYRFSSGDTTEIRLPDGRLIRLLELRVQPRRDDFDLVSGSFWLDARSYDVVRAVYRPARPFDLERDLRTVSPEDSADASEVPGILEPIRLEIRYVSVEYGLWDLRWWLPRLVSVSAEMSAARLLHVPATYEKVYDGYRISTAEAEAGDPVDMIAEADTSASADSAGAGGARADADSTGWGDLRDVGWKGDCAPAPGLRCHCEHGECRYFRVVLPADTTTLLTSADLPPSIFEQGDVLLTRTDVASLDSTLSDLPAAPLRPGPPRLRWGPGAPGLLRYNRIEGLSVGARLEEELGPATAEATVRVGTAEPAPDVDVGLGWQRPGNTYRAAAYRRLTPVQEQSRPLGIGNSLQALLFGVDDGDYFRATGIELSGNRLQRRGASYDWRLFLEHQASVAVGTHFSLRHALDSERLFRPNPAATTADLVGAAITVRLDRGLDAAGVRWGGALRVETATGWLAGAGDVAFARPALRGYATFPLGARLLGALEAEAGTSAGALPPQRSWELGGAGTLRGYEGGTLRGEAFWRGRAEVANDFPAARLSLFTDIGWAGDRPEFGSGVPLLSAGVGGSFLDGVIRVDLARALREPKGWRVALYLDGIL